TLFWKKIRSTDTTAGSNSVVAGDGQAGKVQVQEMVQVLLGLASPPRPADAADAGALALCHLAYDPQLRATTDAGAVLR
ncbi:MAG: crossover junction endodeoxyribonuclease RuvC, partial [Actinomycetota bacterium]